MWTTGAAGDGPVGDSGPGGPAEDAGSGQRAMIGE
ncbi:hypothetical protein QFZ65_000350 [Arthrobacter sp. B3I9]|nr:hypothetical protein [Arthrobacter sp. B3I9]